MWNRIFYWKRNLLNNEYKHITKLTQVFEPSQGCSLTNGNNICNQRIAVSYNPRFSAFTRLVESMRLGKCFFERRANQDWNEKEKGFGSSGKNFK